MKKSNNIFRYGEDRLTSGIALSIARGTTMGIISPERYKEIRRSAEIVSNIANGDSPVYGINTGFGPLCTTMISKEETNHHLQEKKQELVSLLF